MKSDFDVVNKFNELGIFISKQVSRLDNIEDWVRALDDYAMIVERKIDSIEKKLIEIDETLNRIDIERIQDRGLRP